MEPGLLILILVVFFVLFFFYLVPIRLWLAATFAGVHIGIFNLIGMRIRRVVPAPSCAMTCQGHVKWLAS